MFKGYAKQTLNKIEIIENDDIKDEELKALFKGVNLTNKEILSINLITGMDCDLKSLKSSIKALKENNNRNNIIKSGRKKKELPVSKDIIEFRHNTGESYDSIAKSYNMSRTTLYHLLKGV